MSNFIINIEQNQQEGLLETAFAGENLSKGDICYLGTDSKYYKAQSNALLTCSTEIRLCLQDMSINTSGSFLIRGKFLTTQILTSGSLYYISDTVEGEIVLSISDSVNNYKRKIGTAYSSNTLEFNPSETLSLNGSIIN